MMRIQKKRTMNKNIVESFLFFSWLPLLISYLFLNHNNNCLVEAHGEGTMPIIINTWAFKEANQAGWEVLSKNGSALDSIVAACSKCETLQCDHTVGWGGSPDENGETTLDAMIMDGPTHKVGAVAALRQVKNAIGVALAVLKHSAHTMLVGSQATDFAHQMGFSLDNLTSDWSAASYRNWKSNQCQPNYWLNVQPNPRQSCGPYRPEMIAHPETPSPKDHYQTIDSTHHDTIGAVAIDAQGRIASGTSTNGAIHKIPGRVGDSPIPGAGSYADQDIGGAAATGDGDIIMRLLPSYQAIENLRNGLTPLQAARHALQRVLRKYPKAQIGLVVVNMYGDYSAACINIEHGFPFMVSTGKDPTTKQFVVKCDQPEETVTSNHSADLKRYVSNLLIILIVQILLLFLNF